MQAPECPQKNMQSEHPAAPRQGPAGSGGGNCRNVPRGAWRAPSGISRPMPWARHPAEGRSVPASTKPRARREDGSPDVVTTPNRPPHRPALRASRGAIRPPRRSGQPRGRGRLRDWRSPPSGPAGDRGTCRGSGSARTVWAGARGLEPAAHRIQGSHKPEELCKPSQD